MRQAILVVACAISLAACWKDGAPDTMINLDRWKPDTMGMFSPRPSTDSVQFESDPPGAEVRTLQGKTCRTPCVLNVAITNDASVTFSLTGYQPQTIAFSVEQAANSPIVNERGELPNDVAKLRPNPVYAELVAIAPAQPAPASKPAAAKPRPAAPTQTARPAARAPAPDPFPPVSPR
jgi:hypothetical protein